ncbi:MAG: ABC transporter ATP-binding protein [Thermodesulfovibrionales bacterium]|nr:ABC transporter ATP-binding protein [Thermodesulfovibrionales bacterium]
MVALEIRELSVTLSGKEILKDINLTLEEGKFLGIVGPNGSGKTTFLKSILGLIKHSTGEVRVLGKSSEECLREGVFGYVPQHLNLDINFPARAIDVVTMGLYGKLGLFRWPSKKEKEKAREYIELIGMSGHENFPFGEMSGGEQQRISIARALVSNPKILILDEPSTGIDVVGQEDFYHLLKGFQKKLGLTIIMVSHDIGAVTAYVDEIACLNKILYYHGAPLGALDENVLKRLYGKNVDILIHSDGCDKCERLRK